MRVLFVDDVSSRCISTPFQRSWIAINLAASSFVRSSVTKSTIIYLEQTGGPRSVNVCAYMCQSAMLVGTPIFFQIVNVLDLHYPRSKIRIEYIEKFIHKRWQIGQILLLQTCRKSHVAFPVAYLRLALVTSTVKVKVMHVSAYLHLTLAFF